MNPRTRDPEELASDPWATAGERVEMDDGGHYHQPSFPSCLVCHFREVEAARDRLTGELERRTDAYVTMEADFAAARFNEREWRGRAHDVEADLEQARADRDRYEEALKAVSQFGGRAASIAAQALHPVQTKEA